MWTPRSGTSSAVFVNTPQATVPSDESENEVMDPKALREEIASLRRDKKLLHRELEARGASSREGATGTVDP